MRSRGWRIENDNNPRPSCPATAALPSDVAAIQHGGCGSCTGFGVTMRRGKSRYLPWNSKYSSSHICTTARIASSHWSRLSSRGTWNAVCSIGVDRPVPHSTRPLERMSAVATFSATRIGGVNACGISVTPKPRRRFSVHWRERADDHLGRGRVRAPLPEVVLHVPRAVEAQGVGELDLLERLPVRTLLRLALAVRVRPRPRLRNVDLVEKVELQCTSPGRQLPPTLPRAGGAPPGSRGGPDDRARCRRWA